MTVMQYGVFFARTNNDVHVCTAVTCVIASNNVRDFTLAICVLKPVTMDMTVLQPCMCSIHQFRMFNGL